MITPDQATVQHVASSWTNAEFLQAYAAPGRVGLVGLASWLDRRIRKTQRHLDVDGNWSQWSHAFLCEGQRVDGAHWLLESDLDLHSHFVRLGVQENRADKYFGEADAPTMAILDFGLDAAQTQAVLAEGLNLLGSRTKYSIPKAIGTYVAMRKTQLGRRFGRQDERSIYCSAFVHHCYGAAGVDLMPGVLEDNVLPELLWNSPVPHRAWVVSRV